MNALRPDTGNFSKLLVWLGLAMVVATAVVPWLFYRETSVLKIGQAEIRGLTPTAQHTINQRQRTLSRIQGNMKWTLFLLPLGAVLVVSGALGLRRQQSVEEARLGAEAKVAERRATLEPQSLAEQDARLRSEQASVATTGTILLPVESELDLEGEGLRSEQVQITTVEVAPARTDDDAPPQTRRPDEARPSQNIPEEKAVPKADRAATEGGGTQVGGPLRPTLEELRTLEKDVLARLGELKPSGYAFRPQVKLRGPDGSSTLLIDAVFESTSPFMRDVLAEVKQSRGPTRSAVPFMRPYVDDALVRGLRYSTATGRQAVAWLIVMLRGEWTESELERVHRQAERAWVPDLSYITIARSTAEIEFPPPELLGKRRASRIYSS